MSDEDELQQAMAEGFAKTLLGYCDMLEDAIVGHIKDNDVRTTFMLKLTNLRDEIRRDLDGNED